MLEREGAYDPNCHLSYRDLSVDNAQDPSIIELLLRCSKMDEIRKVVIGKMRGDLCPVSALLRYLVVCGSRLGPLFLHADWKPIFMLEVRSALKIAHLLADQFAGHSLRIRAAAAAAGLEDSLIRMLGEGVTHT